MQKTIVFCVDQEHASRMRQALINENQDLVGRRTRATSCASPGATRPD
jgi:type I restriction enzyme, R subunit